MDVSKFASGRIEPAHQGLPAGGIDEMVGTAAHDEIGGLPILTGIGARVVRYMQDSIIFNQAYGRTYSAVRSGRYRPTRTSSRSRG